MKIAKSLRKEATHGGVIPAGWRLAWYEPKRRVGVYYPAPLNWILRVLRELHHRARLAVRALEEVGRRFGEMIGPCGGHSPTPMPRRGGPCRAGRCGFGAMCRRTLRSGRTRVGLDLLLRPALPRPE